MNKAPRFLIEYANYQIKEAENLEKAFPEKSRICHTAIRGCDRAVRSYELGYITIKEAMTLIMEAFSRAIEIEEEESNHEAN